MIGAGDQRDGDVPYWLREMTKHQLNVIRIDSKTGGYEHDWTVPRVREALSAACSPVHS